MKRQNLKKGQDDFIGQAEIMAWFVFILLNLAITGWVLYNLFDFSAPVLSLMVGGLIAVFALICASPLTAVIAFAVGFSLTGIAALAQPKTL
ncbi:hypothetical protein [Bergeriella denitrificans]|uniref:Uncharacterized protein n=1 Tax=Bergeriella denitrificans TaxID=494 RepID=A0A378UFC3_BERDE|nr:hypothetical protein [Bergeriella denitrificans]STZ76108.1 Uncharacterised protein [Bergeriella denitrificans]